MLNRGPAAAHRKDTTRKRPYPKDERCADAMNTRLATPADARPIADIYNHGIETRLATFETALRSESDVLAWFSAPYPIVVGEDETGVAAFAATSPYRPRACYAGIAEFMVYVAPDRQRRGFGRATLEALFQEAARRGLYKLVSRVFVENAASRQLLTSAGFREVGVYERHAQLDGVWRDVVIVERFLEP